MKLGKSQIDFEPYMIKMPGGKSDAYQLGMLIGKLEKVRVGMKQGQRTGTESSTVMSDVNRQLLILIINLKKFTAGNICEDVEELMEFLDGTTRLETE